MGQLLQAHLGRLLPRGLSAGGEAPSYICWGHNNRSALIRVPMYKPGKTGSARVEVRSIDSGANPYLTYAVLLAASKGIEEGYELPAPTTTSGPSPTPNAARWASNPSRRTWARRSP